MNSVAVIGDTADEPQLRFTQAGVPVGNFTLASTERVFDRSSGDWKDRETAFTHCIAWRNVGAENLVESPSKGSRVIATGTLRQRCFTMDDGGKRTVIELEVEEIGAALRYAITTPVKAPCKNASAHDQNAWQMPAPIANAWGAPAPAAP
jgi:single-strand DNA-binding protein